MSKLHRASSYLPVLVLLGIFVAVGVVVLVVPNDSHVGRVTTVLWGVIPTSVAIWQYAYSRIETHRLRVNRVRFWLTNPESTWGLSCEFDVENGMDALRVAEGRVQARPAGTRQRVSASPGNSVWQLDGLTLRIEVDVADDPISDPQTLLRVEFLPSPRAFRTWRRLLGGTVFDLVEQIEQSIRPSRRKYVARVAFPTDNPYFGLFVASISLAQVQRFEIDYFERRATEDDLVQVRADAVRMVTESAHAAKQLSLHYLALQPVGAND